MFLFNRQLAKRILYCIYIKIKIYIKNYLVTNIFFKNELWHNLIDSSVFLLLIIFFYILNFVVTN